MKRKGLGRPVMFSPRAIGGRPRAARIGDLAGSTMFSPRSSPHRETRATHRIKYNRQSVGGCLTEKNGVRAEGKHDGSAMFQMKISRLAYTVEVT